MYTPRRAAVWQRPLSGDTGLPTGSVELAINTIILGAKAA